MKICLILLVIWAGVASGCRAPSGSTGPATADTVMREGDSTARLFVKGMSCPLCANNIDKQLMRVRGVEDVSVNLGTGEVVARLAPGNPPTREELAGAIERSGFTLERIEMPAGGGE